MKTKKIKNPIRFNRFFEEFKYIKIGSFLKISPLILPIIFASFFFGYINLLLSAYITSLLHEFFHILAMKILKIPPCEIIIQPFGICAKCASYSPENSKKELAIALAGPFFNFSAAAFLLIFKTIIPFEKCGFFMILNLAMGLFNLIPALPLDGGRAMRAILSLNFGVIRAYNFMLSLSRVIIFVILFLSIAALLISPFNFQLILGGVFLLSNLGGEQAGLSKIIFSDILNQKIQKESFNLPIKHIAVGCETPARFILKLLSFDYIIEISVIEKNGSLKFHTSEGEVINLLMTRGIRSKFKDIEKLHNFNTKYT